MGQAEDLKDRGQTETHKGYALYDESYARSPL